MDDTNVSAHSLKLMSNDCVRCNKTHIFKKDYGFILSTTLFCTRKKVRKLNQQVCGKAVELIAAAAGLLKHYSKHCLYFQEKRC